MTALTREEVRRIAALARLSLSLEEEERFAAQLGRVVDHIGQLARFETAPDEPATALPAEARDEPLPGLPLDAVLDHAPAAYGRFVAVPRVFESDD